MHVCIHNILSIITIINGDVNVMCNTEVLVSCHMCVLS